MKRNILLFLLIFLSVSLFSCKAQDANKIRLKLLGEWVSYQDSNYVIVIQKNTITEKYIGTNEQEDFKYSISPKNCGVNFNLCKRNCYYLTKTDKANETHECYLIKTISDKSLTLVYEGGAILDFIKISNNP